MANVVLQINQTNILEMKKHYQTHLNEKVPPGAIFSAKRESCTITAYKSGKVLFQGMNAEIEASKWQSATQKTGPKPLVKKQSVMQHAFTPPSNIGQMSIIGSDEVGTGDYFGPITVAAVYADQASLPLLKELGVRDSKNVKDPEILQIASQLKHAVPFSLFVLDNVKYNALQQKGMSQGKIKAYLHNLALKKLIEKIKPTEADGILIDQFAKPDIFFGYLKGQEIFSAKNIYFSTGGESIHPSVAAASILARAAFVKKFEELSKEAGFVIPKGAGPAVDQAAAKLIQAKGIESLEKFTKLHFANTDKAKKLLQKKHY